MGGEKSRRHGKDQHQSTAGDLKGQPWERRLLRTASGWLPKQASKMDRRHPKVSHHQRQQVSRQVGPGWVSSWGNICEVSSAKLKSQPSLNKMTDFILNFLFQENELCQWGKRILILTEEKVVLSSPKEILFYTSKWCLMRLVDLIKIIYKITYRLAARQILIINQEPKGQGPKTPIPLLPSVRLSTYLCPSTVFSWRHSTAATEMWKVKS